MDFDLRDLLLEVTAEITEIIRETMQELAAPQMEQDVRLAWATAPEEMKEQFRNERPQEYSALMGVLHK